MNVTLIGMGSGQPENLTLQGLAALRQADLILGARRLLAVLPAGCTENRAAAYRPDEVAELLQTSGAENAVLVYSGDTGFYSGASSMMEKLEALGVRARVLPGLSSIQLLAAALGRPWQGWNLVSAHGRTCDPVAECMQGKPTFFLTGGSEDPATLCAQLAAEGFGDVQAVVGQCLGTPEEKLFRGSVKELAAGRFNSLSVLLVEAAEVLPRRAATVEMTATIANSQTVVRATEQFLNYFHDAQFTVTTASGNQFDFTPGSTPADEPVFVKSATTLKVTGTARRQSQTGTDEGPKVTFSEQTLEATSPRTCHIFTFDAKDAGSVTLTVTLSDDYTETRQIDCEVNEGAIDDTK